MIDFEYLMNPEKYHTVPPRAEGEKDEQYKARLGAYVQGIKSQQAKIDQLNKKNSEEKRILHNVIEMNQSKIDELQARVDDHDLKLELFINELEKTYREDKDNKIDYWRGFSECADSSIKVFYRDVGFINLKGNKDG